jgi:hypothetical protein
VGRDQTQLEVVTDESPTGHLVFTIRQKTVKIGSGERRGWKPGKDHTHERRNETGREEGGRGRKVS